MRRISINTILMSPVVFLPWYFVLVVWALEYIHYELGVDTGPFVARHPLLILGAIMFSVFVCPFPNRWKEDLSRSSDMNRTQAKIRRYVSISALVNFGGALLVLALAYAFIPMKVAENPWGKFRAGFNPQLWLILVVFGALIALHVGAYLVTKSRLRMKWKAYLAAILSTCYTACFLAPLAGAVAVDIYKSGVDPNLVPWIPYWLGILIFSVPIFGTVFFMVAGIVAVLIWDEMDKPGPVG
jgi:hypothetical protein